MKLYTILLGRTKVPFGQFYGGLSGWEGLGTLVRFITDKSHLSGFWNQEWSLQERLTFENGPKPAVVAR